MSTTPSQPSKPPKISEGAFQASIGVLLGIAVIVAGGRLCTRFYNPRNFAIDDGFFCLAVVTLIAGTTVLYLDVPYIYLQEYVEAGLRAAPADIVPQLIHDEKLQNAAAALLGTTIMSVKFSFLFFFRHLIQRQKKLLIWWWCIFGFLIPTAAIVIFSDLIACPYSDDRIFVKCVTPSALARQNSDLRASVSLDIISDAFLISIPVILLWNVKIPLRRKFTLWAILCLSIFTALTTIIKIAGGNTSHGQVDSAWATFWFQIEASVAVIVVSISAYRALFVAHQASKQHSPAHHAYTTRSILNRSEKFHKEWPEAPAPLVPGVTTDIQSPYDAGSFEASQDMELPLRGPGILVRQDISSAKTHQQPVGKSSAESFV